MSILEKLVGRSKQREQESIASYSALVEQIADGKNIKPEVAEQILSASGKSPSDLGRDVQSLIEHRKLQVLADGLSGIKAQIGELQSARVVEMKNFQDAERELLQRKKDADGVFNVKLGELEKRRKAASQAALDLQKHNPVVDPPAVEPQQVGVTFMNWGDPTTAKPGRGDEVQL